MPRLPALVITDAERAELERRSRARTTSQQALRRARILLAADGVPNRQIATQVGIGPDAVATWRRRFASDRLKGLQDRRRPGRPRVYDRTARPFRWIYDGTPLKVA
jgi:hypothetical protein